MAIVKMRKLNLVAMSYDQDEILNALQRTNAVEVSVHKDVENTVVIESECEELKEYLSSTEAALSVLSSSVDFYEKERGEKSDALKDGFDVPYSEFMSISERKEEVDELVERIQTLADERNACKAELASLSRTLAAVKIYGGLTIPFSSYNGSAHTLGRLGTVTNSARDSLVAALEELPLCAYQICGADAEQALFYITAHKSAAIETESVLSDFGFVSCPYSGEKTGEEFYAELTAQEEELKRALNKNEATMYALKDKIRLFKVYLDYLYYLVEKAETGEKLRVTQKTFLLQAYVPVTAEEEVEKILREVSGAVYFEFSDPTEEDTPPTLLKNNGVVSNFESITNTYSVPSYREFDPNTVMAFFYSLFMGFIIGDMGYGILMLIGGGYLWLKNRARPTGMSRLAGAFAIGGIFAIVCGALFNSLFGFAFLPFTVMPNAQSDMWSFVGIQVPAVLIIAMLIGIVQLFAGYICKAVQEWHRGDIAEGIFSGITWASFSVGVALAIVGLTEELNLPILATIGGVWAGVSLLLAIVTAGHKEKFFGKFTKGFGAAYSVINYASDILSYARLYGLMLSGAVIAQLIAQYSAQFIVSGNVAMIALGVFLLIAGNAFNLVISLLGAYIHDARLQYVEFYGRFYEGDGEMFTPLGSKQKYVYLLPAQKETKQV